MFSAQGRDRKVELKKADVDTDGGEWCQLGSKFQLRLQQAMKDVSNTNATAAELSKRAPRPSGWRQHQEQLSSRRACIAPRI